MQEFAVIGLGKFGLSVAKELIAQGHEVLLIDNNADKIQKLLNEEFVTQAVCADATEISALQELGLPDFDAVVLGIGENLQDGTLTALNLIELGVERIIAKALSEAQGKILMRLGVKEVVFPERDMGKRLASKLSYKTLLDGFDLDPRFAMMEVQSGPDMISKSLRHLNLRLNFGIHVIALRSSNEKLAVVPDPDTYIQEGDSLLILGENQNLKKFIEAQSRPELL